MTTLQPHRIQHSLFLLVSFLQFSPLILPSLGYKYNLPDEYFISCGSDSDVTESGKVYIGESNTHYPATKFSNSTKESIQLSVSVPPLYQTARLFQSQSWYEFSININGTYLLRLHFFAFFSQNNNLSSARFHVSAPGFLLLPNFDAGNDFKSTPPLAKEFFVYITFGTFKITFTPLPSTFAFVNAIELFLLPLHLIVDKVTRFKFTYDGTPLPVQPLPTHNGLLSRALETKHRLNVGGQTVTRGNDSLLRHWILDDSYLANPENAKNSTPYERRINYHVDDDSDGPNSNRYTAPSDVYGTAKEIKYISASARDSNLLNLTWALPVDKYTDHLIRLHFCDIWNPQTGLTIFNLYIYDNCVMQVNYDLYVTNQLPAPYYYDFVVYSDNSGLMNISVSPIVSDTVPKPNAFLNGLEIMKLIESSHSDPSDLFHSEESKSKHNRLPVVLGSVLGSLVLVLVVIFWFLLLLK